MSGSPPLSQVANATTPTNGTFKDHPIRSRFVLRNLANTPQNLAAVAFSLGMFFAMGAFMTYNGVSVPNGLWDAMTSRPLGVFVVTWTSFHMLEFMVTAVYNPSRVNVSSFLIDNGTAYHVAHMIGISEFILGHLFLPPHLKALKSLPIIMVTGAFLIILGQFMRSLAMITAAQSFTHFISERKKDDHTLVTWGIYSWSRHPSYAGFMYWAVGTQLWLGNPFAAVGFAVALWRFFNSRIKGEEYFLKRFFGDQYVTYQKRTGTKIPLIR